MLAYLADLSHHRSGLTLLTAAWYLTFGGKETGLEPIAVDAERAGDLPFYREQSCLCTANLLQPGGLCVAVYLRMTRLAPLGPGEQ